MKNIATALVKAQKAFGKALKSSTNPHFRSKYADLSACVAAVIDALNDNGIALMQQFHECDKGVIVETLFIHESGEQLSGGKLFVPAIKFDAQGIGSCATYARRYSLLAATGLAPEDDDGNDASRRPEVKTPDITDHLLAIQGSGNSDELAKVYKDALEACEGNQTLQAKVIQAKKTRVERAKQEKTA
jgi:hypothetical protein